MTTDQRLSLILASLGIVFIPLLALLIRVVIKWTKVESGLNTLVTDMKELVESKDKIHIEMIKQMAEDRKATDRRLRWLEEHYWKGG